MPKDDTKYKELFETLHFLLEEYDLSFIDITANGECYMMMDKDSKTALGVCVN